MTECNTCRSVIRGETGIRCNGVCDKTYHCTKKCSGIDQYSIGVLESNNFVRFICEDCMQYIRNVDLALGEIQDGVRINKQNLKEYKREFETSLKQNENEIKQLLEAIEKRYEKRLKILDDTQKACEKYFEELKKLFGNFKEYENKNKEMCDNIEQKNEKMCNEIKKVIKETKDNQNKM